MQRSHRIGSPLNTVPGAPCGSWLALWSLFQHFLVGLSVCHRSQLSPPSSFALYFSIHPGLLVSWRAQFLWSADLPKVALCFPFCPLDSKPPTSWKTSKWYPDRLPLIPPVTFQGIFGRFWRAVLFVPPSEPQDTLLWH